MGASPVEWTFVYSNTPPSAAAVAATYDNTAPTASGAPAVSYDNTAPTASGAPAVTYNNTPPDSKAAEVDFTSDAPLSIVWGDQNCVMEGGKLYLWNQNTNRFHAVWITGNATPQFAIAEAGETAPDSSFQIVGSTLMLLNTDTEAYHPIVVMPDGTLAIAATTDRPANYRLLPQNNLQLANLTAGTWHSLYVSGIDGLFSLSLAEPIML